jgi:hypothetical protein
MSKNVQIPAPKGAQPPAPVKPAGPPPPMPSAGGPQGGAASLEAAKARGSAPAAAPAAEYNNVPPSVPKPGPAAAKPLGDNYQNVSEVHKKK